MKNKTLTKLFRDKKGTEFRSMFFALIVFSMMIIAIGVWVNDWNTKYDSGLTYDLGEYERLDEMSTYASGAKADISVKGTVDTASGDFEGTSLRGAFAIINNIFVPFRVVFGEGGLLSQIEERWGIPNYIMRGITSMMVLTIIFAIIALFFRRVQTTA